MDVCVVSGGVVTNIIVCETKADAELFGAKPYYDGAAIGKEYSPPPDPPTEIEQLRADVDYLLMMEEGTL